VWGRSSADEATLALAASVPPALRLQPYTKEEEFGTVTKIIVKSNGSIRVEGEFILCDLDGNAFDLSGRSAISLCRCGHSENKPFCDGSHNRVGFQSEIKARQLPPAAPKPPVPAAG